MAPGLPYKGIHVVAQQALLVPKHRHLQLLALCCLEAVQALQTGLSLVLRKPFCA